MFPLYGNALFNTFDFCFIRGDIVKHFFFFKVNGLACLITKNQLPDSHVALGSQINLK